MLLLVDLYRSGKKTKNHWTNNYVLFIPEGLKKPILNKLSRKGLLKKEGF